MTQVQPYLSIIIPYLNRADLFSRPLRTLKPHAGMKTEVILVDNGSTDRAPQLAARFAESMTDSEWMDVKLLKCPQRNASAARNAGLAEATGLWVYFFDSDDEFSPEFFPDFFSFSQVHADDDLIALRTCMLMPDGCMKERACLYSDSPADQILSSQLATQCMVFKRDFILRIGGWCEKISRWVDWELGVRVLLHHPQMHWMKGRSYHKIYQHPESITGKDEHSAFHRSMEAMEEVGEQMYRYASSPESCRTEAQMHKHGARFSLTTMLQALAAREAILAGKLHREGAAGMADEVMKQARETLPHHSARTPLIYIRSAVWKLFLRFICRYTAKGGRGAWRLALAVSTHV